MDFILSKLISRPKSLVLSADQIENTQTHPNDGGLSIEAQQALKSVKKGQNLNKSEDSKHKEECESVQSGKEVTSLDTVNNQAPQINKTVLNESCEQPNNTSGSKTLPDVISLPVLITKEADDSIISSLANNLNALQLDPEAGSSTDTLTIPTSFCDTASSDDEVYAECQSYADQPNAALGTDINSSIHWDTVLSTVTSSNIENLENTTNENIDTETSDDLIDSTSNFRNSPKTFDVYPKAGSVESGVASSSRVDLKGICRDISIVVDSADGHLNETIVENRLSETVEYNEIYEKETEQNLSQSSDEKLLSSTVENQSRGENFEVISSETTLQNLDTLECDDTEKRDLSEDTAVVLNKTNENVNSSSPGNQTKVKEMSPIPTLKTPSPKKEMATEFTESLSNINNKTPKTPVLKRDINKTTSEISKERCHSNDGPLNSTFVPNSEILNSTVNITLDKAFGGKLDQTFNSDEAAIHNKTILGENSEKLDGNCSEITPQRKMDNSFTIPKQNNSAVVKSPNAGNEAKNTSVEPIDLDVSFIKPVASPEVKNITAISDKNCPRDVFAENLNTQQVDLTFNVSSMQSYSGNVDEQKSMEISLEPTDNDFQENGFILHPEDFDYLLSKGDGNTQIDDRSSLLLRFDPLLGHPVPANQQHNIQNLPGLKASSPYTGRLTPAVEEEDDSYEVENKQTQKERNTESPCLNVRSEQPEGLARKSINPKTNRKNNIAQAKTEPSLSAKRQVLPGKLQKNGKMSADVIQDMNIENDVKSSDDLNTKSAEKTDYKMDDMEKKIKSEAQTEDIEKKLKEAEQKEEALLKRITEKDKTIAKMSGVIEAYEKAIAELIAEKEQIIQNYEKQMAEIKAERDLNYQHLTSLESTFSDLHVKYERSKQLTAKLKANEDELKTEKKQHLENLRLQEQRYEKMKNHAMQQLEIANNKLESLTKNHAMEVTRLKALLKKEEISRLSINEQLLQKSRENEELMKICDELINGQGASS